MNIFTFLMTSGLILSYQADSQVEASKMAHDDGYTIVSII